MSDGNLPEYFPEADKVGMWPFRSCLKCGATVDANHLYLHAEWHERQKSTERLILDNQPVPAEPKWKAGDRALTKPMNGGHVYIGAEEAERLGLKVGADGWAAVDVVYGEDPLDQGGRL